MSGVNGTNSSSFNFNFQMPSDLTSELETNPNAQAAINLLEQLAQSGFGGSAAPPIHSSSSSVSLPSPFAIAQLTELLNNGGEGAIRQQTARQLAEMNTAGSRDVNNNITVNVPGFTDRAGTVQSQTSLVAALVAALQAQAKGAGGEAGVSTTDAANRSKFDADLTKALVNDGRVDPSERNQLMKDLNKALAANPNDSQYYKNDVMLANTGAFGTGTSGNPALNNAQVLKAAITGGTVSSASNPITTGEIASSVTSPASFMTPTQLQYYNLLKSQDPVTAQDFSLTTKMAVEAASTSSARSSSTTTTVTPTAVSSTKTSGAGNSNNVGAAPAANKNNGSNLGVSDTTPTGRPADDGNPVNPQDVFSGDPTGFMSKTELQYYNTLKAQDPDKANLFLLQTKMQKLNEMITFLTQMMTIRHDNAKAILQNLHV